jgi:hypothetical protein
VLGRSVSSGDIPNAGPTEPRLSVEIASGERHRARDLAADSLMRRDAATAVVPPQDGGKNETVVVLWAAPHRPG